jgi:hypothetical protein
LSTEVVDQAEAMLAIFTNCFCVIGIGMTVLDGLFTGALGKVEA